MGGENANFITDYMGENGLTVVTDENVDTITKILSTDTTVKTLFLGQNNFTGEKFLGILDILQSKIYIDSPTILQELMIGHVNITDRITTKPQTLYDNYTLNSLAVCLRGEKNSNFTSFTSRFEQNLKSFKALKSLAIMTTSKMGQVSIEFNCDILEPILRGIKRNNSKLDELVFANLNFDGCENLIPRFMMSAKSTVIIGYNMTRYEKNQFIYDVENKLYGLCESNNCPKLRITLTVDVNVIYLLMITDAADQFSIQTPTCYPECNQITFISKFEKNLKHKKKFKDTLVRVKMNQEMRLKREITL